MVKVTLDMSAFKALASDSRLSILKVLDGKKLSLKELASETSLNKATLHEHLNKLNEAGLVKRKEREGHKWVYYCLTWKGESLLHPENTRIVVMFSAAFFSLLVGVVSFFYYVRGQLIGWTTTNVDSSTTAVYGYSSPESIATLQNQTSNYHSVANSLGVGGTDIEMKRSVSDVVVEAGNGVTDKASGVSADSMITTKMVIWHDPLLQLVAVICFVVFCAVIAFAVWRYWKNKEPSL